MRFKLTYTRTKISCKPAPGRNFVQYYVGGVVCMCLKLNKIGRNMCTLFELVNLYPSTKLEAS